MRFLCSVYIPMAYVLSINSWAVYYFLFLQHLLPAPQSTRALAKLILSHSRALCHLQVSCGLFFGFLRIVLQKRKNDFPNATHFAPPIWIWRFRLETTNFSASSRRRSVQPAPLWAVCRCECHLSYCSKTSQNSKQSSTLFLVQAQILEVQ